MALYESEHTKFMRELLAKHPEWDEDKLVGRALLWDRKIDLAEQKAFIEAKQTSRPYPYDVNFEQLPASNGPAAPAINKVEDAPK
jgi:hypothetical protein